MWPEFLLAYPNRRKWTVIVEEASNASANAFAGLKYFGLANLAQLLVSAGLAAFQLLLAKTVDARSYGLWSLFALYTGYLACTHLGFNEGALLSWTGKPIQDYFGEFVDGLALLGLEQGLVLVLFLGLGAAFVGGDLAKLWPLILITAFLGNLFNYLAYQLVSEKRGICEGLLRAVSALGPALALTVCYALRLSIPLYTVACLYAAFRAVPLLLWLAAIWPGLRSTARADGYPSPARQRPAARCGRVWSFCRRNITSGLPIMLSNFTLLFGMSVDRLVVGNGFSLQSFATYSFARNFVIFTNVFVLCSSLLALPYLGAYRKGDRLRIDVAQADRLVILLMIPAALAYLVAMRPIVGLWLPRYSRSLSLADILMTMTPVNAAIQVVHFNVAKLEGQQRKLLLATLIFATVTGSSLGLVTLAIHSLTWVAIVLVVGWMLWYVLDYPWLLRRQPVSAGKVAGNVALLVLTGFVVATVGPTGSLALRLATGLGGLTATALAARRWFPSAWQRLLSLLVPISRTGGRHP